VPPPWVSPPESDAIIDPTVWDGPSDEGTPAAGEIVLEPGENEAWLDARSAPPGAAGDPQAFLTGWATVRDANIRPFVEWIVPSPVSLPVMQTGRSGGGQPRPNQGGNHHRAQPPQQQGGQHPGGDGNRKRKRRHRRGHQRGEPSEVNRGPRLPGVYNPGGD
jgi:hypothetical protein